MIERYDEGINGGINQVQGTGGRKDNSLPYGRVVWALRVPVCLYITASCLAVIHPGRFVTRARSVS